MKRSKWITVLILCTVILTGCGSKEKPVETGTEHTQETGIEESTSAVGTSKETTEALEESTGVLEESTKASEATAEESENDNSMNGYEEVIPVDQLDTKNYNLAWENDYSDFYETGFKLSIYINAEKNEDGSFIMDDGQNWLACAEIDGKNYYIFPDEFVQIGSIECNVYMDDQDNPYILLSSPRTASYSLTEFIYTEGRLMKKTILERGNYNYLGKSYIK